MKKQIRMYVVMFAVLCMVLPFASLAQAGSPRAELRMANDTNTQVGFYISSDRFGRKHWTWKPGDHGYVVAKGGERLRVGGLDTIEIADWGKCQIEDIATFNDGIWQVNSFREAHRALRNAYGR